MLKNKTISFLIRKTFKKKNSFILQLYVLLNIIFIISSTSQSDKMIRKKNYLSEIHLVIQGNGIQKILSDEFNFKSSDISEILINNEHYNSISNTINELENEENSITIKFNKEIDSCENMFKGLQNITEIDLSQFCSSNVKNMSFMFYGCSNLKYIK